MVSIEPENRRRRQSGVSLVEVLVAIVVLSIGLLGLAGLQASGIRVGQSSIHRSQAAQLAYDMADRIRVNLANRTDYSLALDAAPTGTSVAKLDLQDWRQRLQMLPAGTGSVAINGSQATIIVQWDDARGAATQQQITQFQITAQLAN
jgi:type IV pilus assembly protein PilV